MPPITILIKPSSGHCNIRCQYCFYADEMEKRQEALYGMMDFETLKALTARAFAYGHEVVNFMFQGGEPMLSGLDFFRRAVELQKKYQEEYAGKRLRVTNAIQTNGLLIDEEWARFFHDNHFLVGVSLDGTKELHDRNRMTRSGEGTFRRVMEGIQLLKKEKVEFNILTVITRQNAKSIGKIYSFYKKNHFQYQQYIACLDPMGEERGGYPWSLTPRVYAEFLKELFDRWYQDMIRGDYTYIRYFENLAGMLKGYPPESCSMAGVCMEQWVVEADGSTYPCDFYVLDQWKLGNVKENTLEEMNQKREESGFIKISEKKPEKCRACKWAFLCRGGCRREREPLEQGEASLNYFCESYYDFFEYAIPRLRRLI